MLLTSDPVQPKIQGRKWLKENKVITKIVILRLRSQHYESNRSSPWKKAYMFTILYVNVSEIFKLLKTKAMNLWPESCYSRTPDHREDLTGAVCIEMSPWPKQPS